MTPAERICQGICARCPYKQTCPGYGTRHALNCAPQLRLRDRQDRAAWKDYRDYTDTRSAAANGTL